MSHSTIDPSMSTTMKKTVIAIVALGLPLTFAISAFGQSSMSLSGVIDEGFDITNNSNPHGDSLYQFQSGYLQSNIVTLGGIEDLGGGKKLTFVIKTTFDINSGRSAPGRSFIGLSDDKRGTVTVGRQYDLVIDYLAPTTANGNWGGWLLSHPMDNDNTDGSFLVNNAIKYASPEFAGFKFGGMYAFSNNTKFANDRLYSLGAQYLHGPLLVAAAYLQTNNPGAQNSGATPAGNANFTAARLRIFGAGINYTIGSATLGFVYSNTDVRDPVSSSYLSDPSGNPLPLAIAGVALNQLKFQNLEVNAMYQATPFFFVGAQYVYTLVEGDASGASVKPRYHTVGLMADYMLSKRTDIYVQGAYEKVAGDRTGSVLDNAAIPGAGGISSTTSQIAFRTGIRHKF